MAKPSKTPADVTTAFDLPAARAALAGFCSFRQEIDKLTASDRTAVIAALATDPPVVIAYALQQNGMWVSDAAVRDHRDNDCRCTIEGAP